MWLGSGVAVVVGSYCSDSTPSQGTSIGCRCILKKKKKKKGFLSFLKLSLFVASHDGPRHKKCKMGKEGEIKP